MATPRTLPRSPATTSRSDCSRGAAVCRTAGGDGFAGGAGALGASSRTLPGGGGNAEGGGGPDPTLGLYVLCPTTCASAGPLWRRGASLGRKERLRVCARPTVGGASLRAPFGPRGELDPAVGGALVLELQPPSRRGLSPLPESSEACCTSATIWLAARRRIDPVRACSGAGGNEDIVQPDGYFDCGYQRPLDANQSVVDRSFQLTPLMNE